MDGSIAKGLGTVIIGLMIITFIIGGIPTYFITKSIFYKKGYNSGITDAMGGKVIKDTSVTIKYKTLK